MLELALGPAEAWSELTTLYMPQRPQMFWLPLVTTVFTAGPYRLARRQSAEHNSRPWQGQAGTGAMVMWAKIGDACPVAISQ